MLPAPYRMRNAEDFTRTVRRGVRVARRTLVVHADCAPTTPTSPTSSHVEPTAPTSGVRVGFVVSKAVGGAVRRNAVKRRLRHLVAQGLADSPARMHVVVRALPAAAVEPQRVPADLAAAWTSAVNRLECP